MTSLTYALIKQNAIRVIKDEGHVLCEGSTASAYSVERKEGPPFTLGEVVGGWKNTMAGISPVQRLAVGNSLNILFMTLAWASHPGVTAEAARIPAVFAFGDANVDTGNNNYIQTLLKSNFTPFGETYFHRPTGRVCDGRIILDFLCTYLGLPFLPPYLEPGADFTYGANFGSGGAGATDLADYLPNRGIPLTQQTAYFQTLQGGHQVVMTQGGGSSQQVPLARNITQATFSQALYYMQIGEVDYLELALLAQEASLLQALQTTVQRAVLSSIQTALTTLYSSGARKFLIFTVYPLGCMPLFLSVSNSTNGSCLPFPTAVAAAHNAALEALVATLRSRWADAEVILVRADRVLTDVEESKGHNGFDDTSAGCCGSGRYNGGGPCVSGPNVTLCAAPSRRIYWDMVHYTEAFNSVVAWEAWGGQNYTAPMNLNQLATGGLI